jgi:hypothetical protein
MPSRGSVSVPSRSRSTFISDAALDVLGANARMSRGGGGGGGGGSGGGGGGVLEGWGGVAADE